MFWIKPGATYQWITGVWSATSYLDNSVLQILAVIIMATESSYEVIKWSSALRVINDTLFRDTNAT